MWKACTFWEIVYLLISVISLKPGRKTGMNDKEFCGVRMKSPGARSAHKTCMCMEMPLRTVLIYNTQYRQKCKNRYHSTIKMVFCWCCFFTQGIRISYKVARSLFFADTNIFTIGTHIKLFARCCAGRIFIEIVPRNGRGKKARTILLEVTISYCLFELSSIFTRCCFLDNALCIQTGIVCFVSQCSYHENGNLQG